MLYRILLINVLIITALTVIPVYAFEIEQIDPNAGLSIPENNQSTITTDTDITEDDELTIPTDSDITGNGELTTPTDTDITGNGELTTPTHTNIPTAENIPTTSESPAAQSPRRVVAREDVAALTAEELFMLAFGRAAPARSRNLIMRLDVEGVNFGPVDVVFSEDFQNFDFISPDFSRYLDGALLPEERSKAGDSVGYFNSAVLRAAGFETAANEAMFVVWVVVPAEMKTVQRMNLKGGYAYTPRGTAVKPAFVSAYANYVIGSGAAYTRSVHNLSAGETVREDFVRHPAALSLNGAVMVWRWALDWSASLREPAQGEAVSWELYRRGDLTLSRDFVSRHMSLKLGDVSMVFGGGAVGGARWEYNERLFGNNPDDDESVVSFFMPRAGEVEVYINEVYQQRFDLSAGLHEIRGFGGDIGRNSVRLVLRMADGSIEEVPFEYALSPSRNLRKGESRVTLSAGMRRGIAPSPECFVYFPEDLAVGYNYLYGLTRAVSVGVVGASSEFNSVMMGQTVLGLGKFGTVNISGGANYMPRADMPVGHRVDASFSPDMRHNLYVLNRRLGGDADGTGGPLPYFSLSFSGFYQSMAYNQSIFNVTESYSESMAGVSGSVGFGLWRGGAGFSGGANFNRRTAANAGNYYPVNYSYGARLSQSFFRVPVSASAGVNVNRGTRTPYFSVNASHGFGIGAGLSGGFGRHRFSASSNIGAGMAYNPLALTPIDYPDSVRADPDFNGPFYEITSSDSIRMVMNGGASGSWRWSNGGSGVGAQSYSASVSVRDIFDPEIPGFRVGMSQTHNRMQLSGAYSLMNRSTPFADFHTQSFSASMSGSLMFADGLFAMGRAVGGGFLIAQPQHSLKGAKVHMNRRQSTRQDQSRSGVLGPAYHNAIALYSPTEMTLTVANIPDGAALDGNRFHTVGGYRQGYALRIGRHAEGVLLQAKFMSGGRPVSYVYVTVEPMRDARGREVSDGERYATFTSQGGEVQIGDLMPGAAYRIRFSERANIASVLITIPAGAKFVHDAGVIEVDRAAAE